MDNSLVFMIYHPIPTWFLPMDSQIEWNIYIYIYIYTCVCVCVWRALNDQITNKNEARSLRIHNQTSIPKN